MSKVKLLKDYIQKTYTDSIASCHIHADQLTVELAAESLLAFCRKCKSDEKLAFDMLIDLCGVDYLEYGVSEWQTESTTTTGFSRGVEYQTSSQGCEDQTKKPRFAVVYHLLSIALNQRLRLKVYLDEDALRIPSVINIWKAANWFEREAFDLFGIIFDGHPDLRRILTDYGFSGHPFRKDFPISGHVEMRYDAKLQRIVYEPVDIDPRVLVPKVIRDDNRYDEQIIRGHKDVGHS